jgi:hypothetical protein
MRGPKIMIAVVILSVLITLVYCLRCAMQPGWAAGVNVQAESQTVNQMLTHVDR